MSTDKVMPLEKRAKIHRKASDCCTTLARETGAKLVYAVVMIDAGGGNLHVIDAASGKMIPDMGAMLRSLASAHDAQYLKGGDGGYVQ